MRCVRLDSLELHHILDALILKSSIANRDTALFLAVDGGLVLGRLLLEAHIGIAALEQLRDEMLVYDVALKLGRGNDIAVSELEMLDEEVGVVEGLVAADAGEPLIQPVVLL
jgi:hypothetical protein